MPAVDIVDESFLVVPRRLVAEVVARPERWRVWWPDLEIEVFLDRGLDGMAWTVAGPLVGSTEIWLEEHPRGVVLHYYLRAEPTIPGSSIQPRTLPDSPRSRRHLDGMRRERVLHWKRIMWALKDELEAQGASTWS
ncbi:MAG: polyketide cyclase / dehydrase and lipid transport [Actinomycetota bacterium]